MLGHIGQLEDHRAAITGHCYRMLGSSCDAEDAAQETIVRAWRALERFDGRASLRTWLYRIATNVCLDAIEERARRSRPVEDGPVGTTADELQTRPRRHWLEPVPDARVIPPDASPAEQAALRQSIRLAFVAALQHLSPKQRAALLLMEVLDWSAAEVAEVLETSVPAVNSALQRARATLATRNLGEAIASLSAEQTALVDRYVDAFERYDVATLTSLLHQDAVLSMPPYTLWLQGPEVIGTWLSGRGIGCKGSRLVRTMASGQPAFGQYRVHEDGRYRAWAMVVLELGGDRVTAMTSFLDTEALFPIFGLPLELDAPAS
ncbi:MAG: sigma-70 family RNA polymerase sigma factor [Myxococcota bacterium]